MKVLRTFTFLIVLISLLTYNYVLLLMKYKYIVYNIFIRDGYKRFMRFLSFFLKVTVGDDRKVSFEKIFKGGDIRFKSEVFKVSKMIIDNANRKEFLKREGKEYLYKVLNAYSEMMHGDVD